MSAFVRPVLSCGSSGSLQDLAGVLRVPGADHNVVGPHVPQAVTCPGPAVGKPEHARDAGATQERAVQLGLGLATGDLNDDPVVGASHRRPPNSGPAPRSSGCTPASGRRLRSFGPASEWRARGGGAGRGSPAEWLITNVAIAYPNVNAYASAPGSRNVTFSVRSRTASVSRTSWYIRASWSRPFPSLSTSTPCEGPGGSPSRSTRKGIGSPAPRANTKCGSRAWNR